MTLGIEPTARTVQGKKPPKLRSGRARHVRGTKNENQRAGDDCKDPNSLFMLPLETLQNRKCRKRRRSLRFGFSEANAVLSVEPRAVAASLSMGIVKNVVAVPQQSRHR